MDLLIIIRCLDVIFDNLSKQDIDKFVIPFLISRDLTIQDFYTITSRSNTGAHLRVAFLSTHPPPH